MKCRLLGKELVKEMGEITMQLIIYSLINQETFNELLLHIRQISRC